MNMFASKEKRSPPLNRIRSLLLRFGYRSPEVLVQQGAIHNILLSTSAQAKSARDLNAHAYTRGHDIVFGGRQYQPTTSEGRRLLDHKLAHVVQQSGGDKFGAGVVDENHVLSPINPGFGADIVSKHAEEAAQKAVEKTPDTVAQEATPKAAKGSAAKQRETLKKPSTRSKGEKR